MVVIIHKGNGDFRGIGIIKVLGKELLGVITWRIGAEVQFHNVLHGFLAGWGMGTASLEAKLLRQIMETREEVLYELFLNLWKTYDAL